MGISALADPGHQTHAKTRYFFTLMSAFCEILKCHKALLLMICYTDREQLSYQLSVFTCISFSLFDFEQVYSKSYEPFFTKTVIAQGRIHSIFVKACSASVEICTLRSALLILFINCFSIDSPEILLHDIMVQYKISYTIAEDCLYHLCVNVKHRMVLLQCVKYLWSVFIITDVKHFVQRISVTCRPISQFILYQMLMTSDP